MTQENKHTGIRGATDRAQDMASGMMGMAAAATAGANSAGAFVENAVVGNMYEMQASGLALERSRSDEVRNFAKMLIDDHTTASHQLASTLRSVETPLDTPSEMDGRRARLIDHLREAPEDEFDKRFLEQQNLAHQETLTLFRGFARSGDDVRLRHFAAATIPSLERHLHAVQTLQKS